MNNKALIGMTAAAPEKRYKNFLNTVTDLEKVWFLSSETGYATVDADGFVHVMIWPKKEFCKLFIDTDDKPVSMEIHEFLDNCKTLDDSIRFMVFPTDVNSYVVTTAQLCSDIKEHLDEIE